MNDLKTTSFCSGLANTTIDNDYKFFLFQLALLSDHIVKSIMFRTLRNFKFVVARVEGLRGSIQTQLNPNNTAAMPPQTYTIGPPGDPPLT